MTDSRQIRPPIPAGDCARTDNPGPFSNPSPSLLHVITRNHARGAERVALQLVDGLVQAGWQQRIVALARADGVQGTLNVDILSRTWPGVIPGLRREVRHHHPEVLLAHGGLAAACAAAACFGTPTRVVWQRILEFPDDLWKHPVRRKFLSVVASRMAGVVALTPKAAAEVGRLGYRGPVIYIPNHRPLPAENRGESPPSAWVTGLALPADARTFAFVGHLVDQKDPLAALRVAERVLQTVPEAHFLVAGDGPLGRVMRERAAQSPHAERIHMLGHLTEAAETLLPFVDVVLISSKRDSMTGVAVEAIMVGRPVAAYQLDGLDELLGAGAGLLAPAGDEGALAADVIWLLTDEVARARMSAKAVSVRAQFSTQTASRRYDEFLRSLLSPMSPTESTAARSRARTVVHVMPNLGVGGAEQALSVLAAHHDRNSWKPVVATLHPPRRPYDETVLPELEKLGVPVVDLGVPGRADRSLVAIARATWRLRRELIRRDASVVDSALFEADLVSRAAVVGLPIRHVTHLVNTPYEPVVRHATDGRGAWRFHVARQLDRLSGLRTDLFVALTTPVMNSAAHHLLIRHSKFVVAPRGVDIERFPRLPVREQAVRRLLCVGRLVPQKNHRALLEALTLAPDLELTILGEGPLSIEIGETISRLGLADRVSLVEPCRDVGAFHRRHDAFVIPSLWEGQSNALLEAMASGLPVLASDIDVFREVLDGHAVLVQPNVEGIARGLEQLRSMSHADRLAMSLRLRQRAEAVYSAGPATRRLEEAYEALFKGE